jgi:anti-anti-sigma regulatory factor
MLRITRAGNGDVIFKISGDLDAENVPEIAVVIHAEKKGTRILLDLTDLRSVDADAVKSLEKWEADSIKLTNCSPYIREWIRRQRAERQSEKGS